MVILQQLKQDEILDFFSQRLKSTLSNDYKIFENSKVLKQQTMFQPMKKDKLFGQLFMNYAKNNRVKNYTEKDALLDVDKVLDNVKMDQGNKITSHLNLKVKVLCMMVLFKK